MVCHYRCLQAKYRKSARSCSQQINRKSNIEREKARLLSFSLPQSGAWLSAAPIPAFSLHLLPNEFHAAVKYRLGAPIYEKERKCPYCKTRSLDRLGDHAVACHRRGDLIL